jgi:hypothetical protein
LGFASNATASESTSPSTPLVEGLLRYLGFSSTDRDAVLEKGGVLHSGLTKNKQYPEEVVAVGAMLLSYSARPLSVCSCLPIRLRWRLPWS